MADGDFTDLSKQARALASAENGKKGGRPKGSGTGPSRITQKQVLAARKQFEKLVPKAMKAVEDILDDPDADHSVKLKAAAEVANRTWGTPVNMSVQERIISDERQSPLSDEAISDADTAYLQNAMAALARFLEQEKNTLDVTPDEKSQD